MLRWRKNVVSLRKDVSDARYKKMSVSSSAINVHKEAWFADAERAVYDDYKEARESGMPCGTLWFGVQMRKHLEVLFPDKSADDFLASAGWLRGFFKRHDLVMRSASNVAPLSVHARVPACLKFYVTIQRICADKGGMNGTWGRFTPSHRFNADEVPLEFGCILRRTAEQKGAKRVWIAQPKHKIEMRECTILPLFCAGAEVSECSILLRCAPRKIDKDGHVDPTAAAHGPTKRTIEQLRMKFPNIDIYCQLKGYIVASVVHGHILTNSRKQPLASGCR